MWGAELARVHDPEERARLMAKKKPDFGIWRLVWDASGTRLVRDRMLYNDPACADLDPRPLVPRPRPPVIPSDYQPGQAVRRVPVPGRVQQHARRPRSRARAKVGGAYANASSTGTTSPSSEGISRRSASSRACPSWRRGIRTGGSRTTTTNRSASWAPRRCTRTVRSACKCPRRCRCTSRPWTPRGER